MGQWLAFLRTNFHHLDISAQKWIYHSYRELIYHDIYFLFKDHAAVEDVIQESFLKVIQKAPNLKDTSNIKAWLKKVARNTTLDYVKKNKKYRHVSDVDLVIDYELSASAIEMALADQVEQQIRNETLHSTLDQLNKNYRRVLFLYYFEEKSYVEIADQLQKSEQAVAQMLVRARKQLFHYFSKTWGD